MVDIQPTEEHLRHCMLFYFRMGLNTNVTTKFVIGMEIYWKSISVNTGSAIPESYKLSYFGISSYLYGVIGVRTDLFQMFNGLTFGAAIAREGSTMSSL